MDDRKKIRVAVLGCTGLLGAGVLEAFCGDNRYEVHGSYRNRDILERLEGKAAVFFKFDPLEDGYSCFLNFDYVINCIGIIKPFMMKNIQESIYINSYFPHSLAKICDYRGAKLVHITTDCVYSGKKGLYTEDDLHDALDEYGKSKSLGEPKNCMVLRTSIIGPETHKNASLVAWVQSTDGQEISGFTNHLWNGVTTKQYGVSCQKIIEQDLFEKGLFHIHSPTPVTKNRMVSLIAEKYNINCTINPIEAEQRVDRTMNSKHELNKDLQIPPIEQQIKDM